MKSKKIKLYVLELLGFLLLILFASPFAVVYINSSKNATEVNIISINPNMILNSLILFFKMK